MICELSKENFKIKMDVMVKQKTNEHKRQAQAKKEDETDNIQKRNKNNEKILSK